MIGFYETQQAWVDIYWALCGICIVEDKRDKEGRSKCFNGSYLRRSSRRNSRRFDHTLEGYIDTFDIDSIVQKMKHLFSGILKYGIDLPNL